MKVKYLLPWILVVFLVWVFWGTLTRVVRFLGSIDERTITLVAEDVSRRADPDVTPVASDDATAPVNATSGEEDVREVEITDDEEAVQAVSGWDLEWYRSPYVAHTYPADEAAADIFAEDGVLPETDAWDRLSARETPFLVGEGAYAVINVGQIDLDGRLSLPYVEYNLYILIIRGTIDDGNKDTDLNTVIYGQGYVRGAGNYNYLAKGAYVSLNWTNDQINNGLNAKPNCGGTGCKTVTLVVYDLNTDSYRMWVISEAGGNWARVQ